MRFDSNQFDGIIANDNSLFFCVSHKQEAQRNVSVNSDALLCSR